MKKILLPALIFTLSFPMFSCAASFDCAKAASNTEKLICSDENISKLDEQLAASYKQALENSADKDVVKKAQIEWLKQQRACKAADDLTKAYQSRIVELNNLSSMLIIEGKTPEERIEFLRSIASEAELRNDWEHRNKYFSKALSDSSPIVRKYAAYGLAGSNYVAQLIHVLASDSEFEVRQSAAIGLSSFLTDNGSNNCESSSVIENNLEELLGALDDDATSAFIVEILGARFSGHTPMACCFSQTSKSEVISVLHKLKISTKNKPHSLTKVNLALNNIAGCAENTIPIIDITPN